MDAVISGRAALAIVIDGESFQAIHSDSYPEKTPLRLSELHHLLSDARDLIVLENVTDEEVLRELARNRAAVEALDLTLILLDADLPDDIRCDAASELEELLENSETLVDLEGIMYAEPLPPGADPTLPRRLPDNNLGRSVISFLDRLMELQPRIREVCNAWDVIQESVFETDDDRRYFRGVVVRQGLFRELAISLANRQSLDEFTFTALMNPQVRALKNHREVFRLWLSDFRETIAAPTESPSVEIEELAEVALDRLKSDAPRQRMDRTKVLERVDRQKLAVVEAMRLRDHLKVERFVDDLIDYQLAHGGPSYATKSLCDLATEAKRLGMHRLQLEFTQKSIELTPGDGWAWMQFGDALLKMNDPTSALNAYEQAQKFSRDAVAKTGRAETLKALNRLGEALDAYEAVMEEHPENVVAKNGRAETLKALNRLGEALDAYEAVMEEHPEDVFAKTGHAETLKALNRLEESLSAYEAIMQEHPEDVVAKTGHAETLKALNRLEESLSAYEAIMQEHPENVFAKTGHAETLKALNRLEESLSAYEAIMQEHPENVVAKTGRAETLKALNRLEESLSAYEAIMQEHPEDVVAKNGRAETLKAMNRLGEALDAYETVMEEHPEDVVAKTGRAETLKAMNRLGEALDAYETVMEEHPEDVVAKNGRAETLKALNRLEESLSAYEAIMQERPENVVAKNGHAETLKALNRLEESLSAYEAIMQEHPENVVAKNGLATVLAAMKEFPRALALLPEKAPVTEEDWIGYHIRGMIFLRMGDVDPAIRIFEEGVRSNPRPESRDYFRTALALARLYKREYESACNALDQVTSPVLSIAADTLRIHAFGQLGDVGKAEQAYRRLPEKGRLFCDLVKAELYRRYISGEGAQQSDEWLIQTEIDCMLMAA